jgi:hypothetical protein
MSTPSFSLPRSSVSLRRFADLIRERVSFEEARERREHDAAMASDYRLADEHRAQANRSIQMGQGGCRFCD